MLTLAFLALFLLSGIFGPMPKYEIADGNRVPANDSSEFLALIESLVDAKANRNGRLEVLTNGDCFYEAELAAIASARRSVNLQRVDPRTHDKNAPQKFPYLQTGAWSAISAHL